MASTQLGGDQVGRTEEKETATVVSVQTPSANVEKLNDEKESSANTEAKSCALGHSETVIPGLHQSEISTEAAIQSIDDVNVEVQASHNNIQSGLATGINKSSTEGHDKPPSTSEVVEKNKEQNSVSIDEQELRGGASTTANDRSSSSLQPGDNSQNEETQSIASSEVTIASPLMEEVKQRAAMMRSEYGEAEDEAKDIYHLKRIKFKGRSVPIVTQNVNGPCPLLALINVLLLQEKIRLSDSAEVVTSSQLMGFLGDLVLHAMPEGLEQGEQANWEQNVNDAIAVFHKLQTGLDVNVRFTDVTSFEYTSELAVFDLLHISLYHGWLVDVALKHQAEAVGSLTYNQLVEVIIKDLANKDPDKQTRALLCQQFIEDTASQLTYHGLSELHTQVQEDQLAVFFRNNHFSTIYKYKGELFLLVTDQGYLRESRVVWESLANVEGDGALVDSDFRALPPASTEPIKPPSVAANTKEQVDQDMLLAMSLEGQADEERPSERASAAESDEQFAKRLQEEEDRRAAIEQQQQDQREARRQPAAEGPRDPDEVRLERRSRKKSCIIL